MYHIDIAIISIITIIFNSSNFLINFPCCEEIEFSIKHFGCTVPIASNHWVWFWVWLHCFHGTSLIIYPLTSSAS
jgi:hypothetical protein